MTQNRVERRKIKHR